MKKFATAIFSFAMAALAIIAAPTFADEGKPNVIRIGFPVAATGNRPLAGNSPMATANLKGMLEEEFKGDGIRIDWSFYKFAGPAVNEAFANNLLDFAYLGDLAMIIGKSGGLKTKILAGGGERLPVALVVPSDSSIKSVADLKGKRVAIAKGTAVQLAASRIFAKAGLDEKDVRIVNVLGVSATDAIATRDVDALITASSQVYPMRDRGVGRIVADIRDTDVMIQGAFVGMENFTTKYPEITKRIIKVLVKGAQYSSDEKNRGDVFKLWGQDGTGYAYYKEQYVGDTLAEHQTPLIDDYLVGRLKAGIEDSKKFKLIRKDIDFNAWVDRSFLDASLKELGLENYWTPYGEDGKPVKR